MFYYISLHFKSFILYLIANLLKLPHSKMLKSTEHPANLTSGQQNWMDICQHLNIGGKNYQKQISHWIPQHTPKLKKHPLWVQQNTPKLKKLPLWVQRLKLESKLWRLSNLCSERRCHAWKGSYVCMFVCFQFKYLYIKEQII